MNRELLKELLVLHEDLRLKPYTDTVGKLSIGVGRNLTDMGVSHDEAMNMLSNDIDRVISQLKDRPWFIALSDNRKCAIADMVFNLGINRFLGFKKLIAALVDSDYELAAKEMLDSQWARQVGDRSETLAEMMRSDSRPV